MKVPAPTSVWYGRRDQASLVGPVAGQARDHLLEARPLHVPAVYPADPERPVALDPPGPRGLNTGMAVDVGPPLLETKLRPPERRAGRRAAARAGRPARGGRPGTPDAGQRCRRLGQDHRRGRLARRAPGTRRVARPRLGRQRPGALLALRGRGAAPRGRAPGRPGRRGARGPRTTPSRPGCRRCSTRPRSCRSRPVLALDDYHLISHPAVHRLGGVPGAAPARPPAPGDGLPFRAADRRPPPAGAGRADRAARLRPALRRRRGRRAAGRRHGARSRGCRGDGPARFAPRAGPPGSTWPASRCATARTRRPSSTPSPATTAWWSTTSPPRCSTTSRPSAGSSSSGPRSSAGSADRCATPWPAPATRSTRWPSSSARTSSWCRWTAAASGTATTISSVSSCSTSWP